MSTITFGFNPTDKLELYQVKEAVDALVIEYEKRVKEIEKERKEQEKLWEEARTGIKLPKVK